MLLRGEISPLPSSSTLVGAISAPLCVKPAERCQTPRRSAWSSPLSPGGDVVDIVGGLLPRRYIACGQRCQRPPRFGERALRHPARRFRSWASSTSVRLQGDATPAAPSTMACDTSRRYRAWAVARLRLRGDAPPWAAPRRRRVFAGIISVAAGVVRSLFVATVPGRVVHRAVFSNVAVLAAAEHR